MELRPYQKEALDAIVEAESRGISRQLIVLPTGTGKTILFTSLGWVRDKSYPMLVIAHREELLDQAAEKFALTEPALKVGKEQAEHHADLNCDIVVGSVATIGRANTTRLMKWAPDHFATIVTDEAHHASSESYRRVFDYFTPKLLLGVTATPQRSDNVRLSDVFQEVVFYRSIIEMIDGKWLAPLVGYRVNTDTDITGVSSARGDYNEAELTKAIDTPERNALVVKAYNDLGHNRPCLVFAAGIQHAKDLAEAFKRESVRAEYLVGDTLPELRHHMYESLRNRELDVLINVGVLTEGFDEPSISCIILARPTRSNLLYTQIVGRGTRLHASKSECLIIDMADVTKGKKPVGLPSLVGLAPDFDMEGRDLEEVYNQVRTLADKSPESASRVRSLGDIEAEYKLIDIFRPAKPSEIVLEHSKLIWAELGEGSFTIGVGDSSRVHIRPNALGEYDVVTEAGGRITPFDTGENIQQAFRLADNYILTTWPDQVNLLHTEAKWREDGPTEKQEKYLRRIGVPITTDMTKGQASAIISKHIEDNPRSFAQQAVIDRAKKKKLSGGW